mgnify:CR=1 FL=1
MKKFALVFTLFALVGCNVSDDELLEENLDDVNWLYAPIDKTLTINNIIGDWQVKTISSHFNKMKEASDKMLVARKKANKIESMEEKSFAYCDEVKVLFDEIRYHADKLEIMVDDEIWPLPKFREMLFTR